MSILSKLPKISPKWRKNAGSAFTILDQSEKFVSVKRRLDRLESKVGEMGFSYDSEFCHRSLAKGLKMVISKYSDIFLEHDKFRSPKTISRNVHKRYNDQVERIIVGAFDQAQTREQLKSLGRVLVDCGFGHIHFRSEGLIASVGTISIKAKSVLIDREKQQYIVDGIKARNVFILPSADVSVA